MAIRGARLSTNRPAKDALLEPIKVQAVEDLEYQLLFLIFVNLSLYLHAFYSLKSLK